MKDTTPESSKRDLPTCPLSRHCLRLVDELVRSDEQLDLLASELDLDDELLLRRLRDHIPTCPACQDALEQARHVREQQRTQLQAWLAQAERRVPATTDRILAALREEASRQPIALQEKPARNGRLLSPEWQPANRKVIAPRQSVLKKAFVTFSALAALLIAAVGLLGIFSLQFLQHGTQQQPTQGSTELKTTAVQQQKVVPASTWSSLLAVEKVQQQENLVLYNPANGQKAVIVSSICPQKPNTSKISHKPADEVLYQCTEADRMTYYLLRGQKSFSVSGAHTHSDRDYNAVWNTDDKSIFTYTDTAIIVFHPGDGTRRDIPYTLNAQHLHFAYKNTLYYTVRVEGEPGLELRRFNLETKEMDVLLTGVKIQGELVMSPLGDALYFSGSFKNMQGFFRLQLMGETPRLIGKAQTLAGFDSYTFNPIVLQTNGLADLIEIDATDGSVIKTLAKDVAPGSSEVLTDVALLSPEENTMLITAGRYPDGTVRYWYRSLTGTQEPKMIFQSTNAKTDPVHSLQWIGWSMLLASPDE